MAVEDGAVLGILLGKLDRRSLLQTCHRQKSISSLLLLYESLRKHRTTLNVLGAVQNQEFYHLPDGGVQVERDELLGKLESRENCRWNWGDSGYPKELLGFDVIADTEKRFEMWVGSEVLN